MAHRHLARPEAFQPHLVLGVGQPLVQAILHVAGGNGDFDLALQAGVQGFGDLHRSTFFNSVRGSLPLHQSQALPGNFSPGRGQLPMRVKGLEPPRLAPQEPKSCVSTSFTTPARAKAPTSARLYTIGRKAVKGILPLRRTRPVHGKRGFGGVAQLLFLRFTRRLTVGFTDGRQRLVLASAVRAGTPPRRGPPAAGRRP